jgi:hypothetical protein
MMRHRTAVLAVIALCSMSWGSPAQADDLIVQKKTFALPSYTTVAGETIKSLKIATLVGPNGHLNAFTAIGQGAEKITAFLAK